MSLDSSRAFSAFVDNSLVVIIPIWVLWTIQMRTRQKLGLGIFLCSNVLLIIVSCLTVSGLRYHGIVDVPWSVLGLQLQTSGAVLVFSFISFRSLFTTENPKFKARDIKKWYSSPILSLRKTGNDALFSGDQRHLPRIPAATLTSLRTFIRGGRRISTIDTEIGLESHRSIPMQDLGQIMVTHRLSSEVQEVL